MKNVIYMDYQATTPCDKRVLDEMLPYFSDIFANPHSKHVLGMKANEVVEIARERIANFINASDSREIIFTSGATEANNLAIQGVAHFYKNKGNRIITTAIEHKCVLESANALKREGYDVVILPVQKNGIIDLDELNSAINDKTLIVSVGMVNNEIGVIEPIEEISKICREKNVLFHTDAAQAVGKIPVNAQSVDLMSISGHKIYGPKGIGALYVRMKPRVRLTALFFGGGQERGMRSGTLPLPLCVGLGAAAKIAQNEMESEYEKLFFLKNFFIDELLKNLKKVTLNGDREKRIPGCLNFSFEGIEGESIMLGMQNVCISSGSACTSMSLTPSHVLTALGVGDLAHSSLRIGLGRFTTHEEVKYVIKKLIEVVTRLRSMSPIWNED